MGGAADAASSADAAVRLEQALSEFSAPSASATAAVGSIVASGTMGRSSDVLQAGSSTPIGWREAWRGMATPQMLRGFSGRLVKELPDPDASGCCGGGASPMSQLQGEQRDMFLALRQLGLDRGNTEHVRAVDSLYRLCTSEVPARYLPAGSLDWEVIGA